MKKITKEEIDLIISLVNEGLTKYSPAVLEKDIHLTEILKGLSFIKTLNENIFFGGGTSLVKGYQIINRMSEDLDFKIVLNEQSIKISPRNQLKKIKNQITALITELGFVIERQYAANHNKYFSFEIKYKNAFEFDASLRNFIKLEFFYTTLIDEVKAISIDSILNRILGVDKTFQLNCVSINQTSSEKIVSFLNKFSFNKHIPYDPRINRHLYDLYFLIPIIKKEKEFSKVFTLTLENEAKRFKLDMHQLVNLYVQNKYKIIQNSQLEQDFIDFVENIVLDKSPSFKDSLELFNKFTTNLFFNNQISILPSQK